MILLNILANIMPSCKWGLERWSQRYVAAGVICTVFNAVEAVIVNPSDVGVIVGPPSAMASSSAVTAITLAGCPAPSVTGVVQDSARG